MPPSCWIPPRLWGYLSAELGNLSNLQILNLSGNRLMGKIPAELQGLTNLHTLDLHGNQLTGGIPSRLSRLADLQTLDLSDNELSMRIPGQLTELAQLRFFAWPVTNLPGASRKACGAWRIMTSAILVCRSATSC